MYNSSADQLTHLGNFLHDSLSNDFSLSFFKAPRWEVCFQDDLSAKVVSPALINLVLCLATIVIILAAAVPVATKNHLKLRSSRWV